MEFMYSKELFLNLIVEFFKVNCELSIRSACQFLNFGKLYTLIIHLRSKIDD